MKKIFTLLTMALLTIGAQAQTVYDFSGLTADDFTVNEAGSKGSYKMDGVEGPSVNYTSTTGELMVVGVKGVTLEYKNGDASNDKHKDNVIKTSPDFIQLDSKNFYIKLSDVPVGKIITVYCSAKGSTNSAFGTLEGCVVSGTLPTIDKKDAVADFVAAKFKATASSVSIRETGGGVRISKITITDDESADDPATPHVATVWDFTKTTVELLDPSKWTEDANTSGRYTYGTEIASNTFKDLGELGCSEGLGLLVGRSGNKLAANSIRVDIGKQIQINASNGVFKITDLAKDDVVRVRFKNASNSEVRTFTVTNGDVTSLNAPKSDDENAEQEATITVAADGDLLLTQSKAINVYAITVNAALPEVTGISTINAETVNDAIIYNLSGQRVDENYRGVVIKNGKKIVIK